MPKKLTYEKVKEDMESQGYELVSKEYYGSQDKINTLCPNGHNYETTYNGFKNGKRCSICSGKKLSYDYVYNFFKDKGCLLLSKDYKNNSILLDYQCECGNIAKIRFSDFQYGKRCRKCGTDKMKKSQKLDYEFVEDYFKQNNCVLLSKEYLNNNQILDYICSCGNPSTTRFSSFQKGHRCRECGNKKLSEVQRFDYEFIKKIFEDNNCVLLEQEYINCDIPLLYTCSCGENYETSFYNFVKGSRCKKCRYAKTSGENNCAWTGGLTKLNHYLREKLNSWKLDVLKSNNYKCTITGLGGTLEVHHIYSFNKIIKDELERLNIEVKPLVGDYNSNELELITNNILKRHTNSLGAPMLPQIHKLYHSIFGFDNDAEQFELFRRGYLEEKYK